MSEKLIIDVNDPSVSNKVSDEKETRKKFLTVARWAGREKDMLLIFAKYDKMLHNCEHEDKRKDLAKIGAIETYKLLGECFRSLESSGVIDMSGLGSNIGELWVDGEMVYRGK